jgi:hypothetical protein
MVEGREKHTETAAQFSSVCPSQFFLIYKKKQTKEKKKTHCNYQLQMKFQSHTTFILAQIGRE